MDKDKEYNVVIMENLNYDNQIRELRKKMNELEKKKGIYLEKKIKEERKAKNCSDIIKYLNSVMSDIHCKHGQLYNASIYHDRDSEGGNNDDECSYSEIISNELFNINFIDKNGKLNRIKKTLREIMNILNKRTSKIDESYRLKIGYSGEPFTNTNTYFDKLTRSHDFLFLFPPSTPPPVSIYYHKEHVLDNFLSHYTQNCLTKQQNNSTFNKSNNFSSLCQNAQIIDHNLVCNQNVQPNLPLLKEFTIILS